MLRMLRVLSMLRMLRVLRMLRMPSTPRCSRGCPSTAPAPLPLLLPGERRSLPGPAAFCSSWSSPGLPSAGNFLKLGEIPSSGQILVPNSPSLLEKNNKKKGISFNVFYEDHR